MFRSVYQRLFESDIPLKGRALQVANRVALPALGGALGVIYLVEYPKCGGSWLRNMLQTYLDSPSVDLTKALVHKDAVLQLHELHSARLHPAVVVVRDPRDAYTSFYHYENNFEHRASKPSTARWYTHDPQRPVKEDFHEFLKAKLLHPSHPWFYFSEFVASWRNRADTHWVRYEDLLSDCEGTFTQLLRSLGRPLDLERVAHAVEYNSFAAVTRRKYGEQRAQGQADNSRFVRKGVAGDWKNHFNRASAELLQQVDGAVLKELGYEPDAAWVQAVDP